MKNVNFDSDGSTWRMYAVKTDQFMFESTIDAINSRLGKHVCKLADYTVLRHKKNGFSSQTSSLNYCHTMTYRLPLIQSPKPASRCRYYHILILC